MLAEGSPCYFGAFVGTSGPPLSPPPGPQHCLEITLLIGGLFLLSTHTLSLQSGEPWKVHMFLTISCPQNMNSGPLAATSTSEWVCKDVR